MEEITLRVEELKSREGLSSGFKAVIREGKIRRITGISIRFTKRRRKRDRQGRK